MAVEQGGVEMDETRRAEETNVGTPLPEVPVIGREPELSELLEVAAAAWAARSPRAVTLLGGAGVGKSRLLSEALVRLRAREPRWRILRTQVRAGGAALGPIQRLLRARFGLLDGRRDTEEAAAIVRAEVEELLEGEPSAEFLHFLGAYLGLDFPGTAVARAVEGDETERGAVGRAVLRRFLELDAARRPLLIVVDDVHEAQPDTLDLFSCLVRGLRAAPVGFFFAARPELLARAPEWPGAGVRHHLRLELSPLEPDEAANLVERLLATRLPEVPEVLVEAAVEEAGGNPYLLRQLVRAYETHGVLRRRPSGGWSVDPTRMESAHLPLDVEQAIEARVASLSVAERELLERAASLGGGVFWLGALVAIERHGRPAPELWGGQESLIAHYEELLADLAERDFVMELPGSSVPGEREYAFRHNLERERLAAMAPAELRRRSMRIVAEWLAARLDEPDEAQREMLVQAYEAGGVPELAARHALVVARRARARYANRKAAEFFRRALDLMGEEDPVTRLTALHDYGDVLQVEGDNEGALAAFRAMLELAYRLDLKRKGGVAHNRIGRLYRSVGRLGEAMRHLGTAQALFEAAGDERGIASTLDDIGKVHWMRGDYEKAERFVRMALERREALGDGRGVALAYNNLGLVYQDSGRFAEALEAFEEALVRRRALEDLPGIAQTLNNLGTIYQDRGEPERAEALFRESLDVARKVGDRMREAVALTNLGESECRRGDPERALATLREAEELASGLGDLILEGEILRALAKAHLLARREGDAREHVEAAIARFEEAGAEPLLGVAWRTMGEVCSEAGWGGTEYERARDAFERALEIFERLGNEVEWARTAEAYADLLERMETEDVTAPRAAALRERAARIRARQLDSGEGGLPPLAGEPTEPSASPLGS